MEEPKKTAEELVAEWRADYARHLQQRADLLALHARGNRHQRRARAARRKQGAKA